MRDILLASITIVALSCRPRAFDYLSPPTGNDARVSLGGLGLRLSQAMQREYTGQLARPHVPASLIPTDGSELELRALAATVTIAGPLAHTELHFSFHNPENRPREGRFAVTVPPGAAVGRFAMKVNSRWREARIVTREKGREVYENFVHNRTDPALLEKDAGNQFSARVFPIAALEDKEIIVGYEHVVSDARPYTLALAGLPAIPKLAVTIDHDGVTSTLDRSGAAPEDLVVPIARGNAAVLDGETFVARVEMPALPDRIAPLNGVAILVDTSASRSTVMGRQADFVRRLAAALQPEDLVSITAFDQGTSELYRGPARGAGAGVDLLLEHGALGASDLGAALDRQQASGTSRLIVVGDGTPTLGEVDAGKLAAWLAGFERVDAVQIGQSLDRGTLQQLVGAGKSPGAILDGRDVDRVLRQLAIAMPPEVPIVVDGATQQWPATTKGIAPGEPVFVIGVVPARPSELAVQIGDHRATITAKPGDATLIQGAFARAQLGRLVDAIRLATTDDARGQLRRQVARLAEAKKLLSPETSLMVFENDADELRMVGPVNPPVVDPAATATGVTIDPSVPIQGDPIGISFSGSTQTDSYYVDTRFLPRNAAGQFRISHRQSSDQRKRETGFQPFAVATEASGKGVSGPHKRTAKDPVSPYEGRLLDVMTAIAKSDRDHALELATTWQLTNPGEVAAVISLGEALEARGATALAARAYGSLVDLYPNRAELLRVAGERLDRLAAQMPAARGFAIDAYRRALRERPDQLATYRLLALSLLRENQADEAFDVLLDGIKRGRSQPAAEVLAQHATVIAAHLVARDPGRRVELDTKLQRQFPSQPAMYVVLTWETDANDVDLHVRDRDDDHAFHGKLALRSGGSLVADVRDGFGPEMFVVENPHAFPYKISAHYFDRGAMGISFGTLQVIRHDGAGNISIEDRPFVMQRDGAMVELGSIR